MFEGREAKGKRLRSEIAGFNATMDRIEAEDLEITARINQDPSYLQEGTESLARNSQATIANRQEISKRASQLGITYDEARQITGE